MKIVTAAEMREIDRVTTERFGVPSLTLMENAGTAVANFVLSVYASAHRITVVCGKGNNGGDGFVAARQLHQAARELRVVLMCDPKDLRGDAAEMFRRIPVEIKLILVRSGDELQGAAERAISDCDLLVDAILGTGFKPPVVGLYAKVIERIGDVNVPVVAVDIPSGIDADAMDTSVSDGVAVPSVATVTFTAPRPAHVFSSNGMVEVAPIGSPDGAIQSTLKLEIIAPGDVRECAGLRPKESHKGNFGHVLVIGGSVGKAGAAAMAGMAALRAGAGLVTVATAQSVLPTIAGFAPELMTEPLPETDIGSIALPALQRLDEILHGKTILAVGPGISRHPETSELVRRIVNTSQLPIVLDADGLNAFAGHVGELDGRPVVITPHPGEMSRLTSLSTQQIQKDRLNIARDFASRHAITVVLKGHRTLIAEPNGRVWVNTTGNPGMASGGMGDILTGVIAGLLAQTPHALTAVLAGIYLHGLAGDLACEKTGEHSLLATDLLTALPEAFRRTREAAGQMNVRFHA